MVDTANGSTCTFRAPQDGYYYGVLTEFSVKDITAKFDEDSTTFKNVDRDFILDLGYMKSGEQVTLTGADQKNVSVSIYRLLQNEFIDAITQLNEEPLVIDFYNDTEIRAHITALDSGILFTSIPYEEGRTIYADGVPVETTAFADAFVSILLPAGEHTITMKYMPVGLQEGAIISLVSLAILLIVVIVRLTRRHKKSRPSLEEQRKLRFPKEETDPPLTDEETPEESMVEQQ